MCRATRGDLFDQMYFDLITHQFNAIRDCAQANLTEERDPKRACLLVTAAHHPVSSACAIRNEQRTPIAADERASSRGNYPYYGPTGILDHISEFRYSGQFALIGEDGDHFLKHLEKDQTLFIEGKFSVNNHAHVIADTAQCSAEWFAWYFRHRSLRDLLTRQGANRYKLTKEALQSLPILLPPLNEQSRITSVLRTWDAAIDKTRRLFAAKENMFHALLVRTFETTLKSHQETTLAKNILRPVSERGRPDLPLLAVMQDIGIVRRDELDRRVTMPDGDGSTYKVVQAGDFVISLRSFEGGLEYSTIEGLVSPAYTVLRPTTTINDRYYQHFFKSKSFIGRLDRLIFGIRDGKQIAFRDFGDMQIPHPPIEKQKAVADHLDVAAHDIELTRLVARNLEHQKRGLMQKLLTGEWRVPLRNRDAAESGQLAAAEIV